MTTPIVNTSVLKETFSYVKLILPLICQENQLKDDPGRYYF